LGHSVVVIVCMKLTSGCCVPGLDDDVKADMEERNGNKSDSDSDDTTSRQTAVTENGYQQPVETPYMENSVEELGQVCLLLVTFFLALYHFIIVTFTCFVIHYSITCWFKTQYLPVSWIISALVYFCTHRTDLRIFFILFIIFFSFSFH